MKKITLGATIIAASLTLSASAFAGTYVPGALPSEFQGGFVAPLPGQAKAEDNADKALTKLMSSARKCFRVGAKNVSRGRPSKVDECLNGPHGAVIRYNGSMAKIDARHNLPTCTTINLGDPNAVIDAMADYNPLIYCQSPSGAFIDSPLL